jgi:hypothetical protein
VEKKTVGCGKKEIVTVGRDAKRNTVKYALRRDSKVVHKGKTDDQEKRVKKPTQQGKRFTISTTSFEVCRNPASKSDKSGIDIDE